MLFCTLTPDQIWLVSKGNLAFSKAPTPKHQISLWRLSTAAFSAMFLSTGCQITEPGHSDKAEDVSGYFHLFIWVLGYVEPNLLGFCVFGGLFHASFIFSQSKSVGAEMITFAFKPSDFLLNWTREKVFRLGSTSSPSGSLDDANRQKWKTRPPTCTRPLACSSFHLGHMKRERKWWTRCALRW